ncbi:hypothetical protein [Deinococcus maricopensis]|uniref:Cell division protein FtsL n=1 Tax=Deinococcus maricopensis (strain DSM 21211 / LMG 22137 / NRRL B-23946 / LB-34) TaxID=709986 RepID=E8U9I3_DEIML|nr:hypothetical protein [Deinococcus maricopensis]ADV67722.1 hypothetical protein Deima_2079 [Deinococcus maricopensis DSM 21211]
MNTPTDTWRARALRYTLIYVLLACVLVGLRYQTRDVRPTLNTLNAERVSLQQQRAALELTVQGLTSEPRVRAWALQNGMTPFTRIDKTAAAFKALPVPAALVTHPTFEVITRWK